MKKKILIYSFFLILLTSQLSFINSKNVTFLTKATDIPYMPYGVDSTTFSGKSIDIMDQNNNNAYAGQNGTAIAYFQVIDNSTNDYFNFITNLSSTERTMTFNLYDHNGGYYDTDTFFYPSLSNIKNNDTYYISFLATANRSLLSKFLNFGYAIGSSTSEPTNEIVKWSTVNNDPNAMEITHINHYAPTDIFPYISPYSNENADVFEINNIDENGGCTFTIKVNNWTESTETDYLTEEQNIGVTLVNEDETDEYLKYEQYQANLISKSNNYYTYQITGLIPEANYTFYSINFTGLTIGNSVYYPDFDIRLTDELGVPKSYTTIYQAPYIDPNSINVFAIKSIDAKSIEFSLKIVDSYDNYLNYLNTEDNTIDVTLKNVDTGQNITTDAVFEKENNDIFTFQITGLDSNTNYQFVSLDNTGLIINGVVDPVISFEEDLKIYNAFFTTKSNLTFYLIIGISLLFIITLIVVFIYLLIKKSDRKIRKKISSSL